LAPKPIRNCCNDSICTSKYNPNGVRFCSVKVNRDWKERTRLFEIRKTYAACVKRAAQSWSSRISNDHSSRCSMPGLHFDQETTKLRFRTSQAGQCKNGVKESTEISIARFQIPPRRSSVLITKSLVYPFSPTATALTTTSSTISSRSPNHALSKALNEVSDSAESSKNSIREKMSDC